MNKDLFPGATIRTHREPGPLGPYLEALATALQNQHYAPSTRSVHLRQVQAFGGWLQENHHPLAEVSELTLARYLNERASPGEPLPQQQRQKITAALHLLLAHLRSAGVIAPAATESLPVTEVQQWLTRYEQHLEKVQGLAPTTRQQYLRFAARLLNTLSQRGVIAWSTCTADKIIAFVRADAAPRKGFGPHTTATAVRSLLRFLVSQGRLPVGLETAIPTIRRWSQAALPHRLNETEIAGLLASCADATANGQRNYAILLLLSRLGLRAKEVARLQLNDVDWAQGN